MLVLSLVPFDAHLFVRRDCLWIIYCCQAADKMENTVLRNMFFYEQAPDTALCMTLLDLYSSNER